jgi:predicted NAD/FAD-binding protein
MNLPHQPPPRRKTVAVIGSGAAALGAAWVLARRHDVVVYEKNAYAGGHANTVEVPGANGGSIAVDTGFIVYNERNYPNLVKLLAHLGVATQPTGMGFAVSLRGGRLEYSGGSLSGLLAQKSNLLRPRFIGMVADLLRFYREAPLLVDEAPDSVVSLGDYLDSEDYGAGFVEDHILPMAAAIWSAPAAALLDFPAVSFVRFCRNHGLLSLAGRPQWRTVTGGSRRYVERLAADLAGRIRLGAPVRRIERDGFGVDIVTDGERRRFDAVVLGCHADEALALLADPTLLEIRLLGSFRFQSNRAWLHGDPTLMPKRCDTWSAWNYLGDAEGLCVTYWMNALQSLDCATPLFVTLNPPYPPARAYASFDYAHPIFDRVAMAAQAELDRIQGVRNSWFCGAWTGYGFHEDALTSGLRVAEMLGCRPPWAETTAVAA